MAKDQAPQHPLVVSLSNHARNRASGVARVLRQAQDERGFLLGAIGAIGAVVIGLSTPAHARDSLGMFESWGAFRDAGVPRCYAIAMADKPAGAKVDYQAYADVGHWPKRALRNQVHFRLSKRLAANAPIRLRVDTQDFALTGGGGDAWAADRRMDAAIVAAMRSGKAMRVRATAADGRAINDFYPLPGAASAIDAAALGCAAAR